MENIFAATLEWRNNLKKTENAESESPALEIMDIAARKGGIIMYSNPHIPEVKTHSHASLQSLQLTAETLQNADCVVLAIMS
jgi:UDP-N-acetyl-D-glucosamine dehydrogenase